MDNYDKIQISRNNTTFSPVNKILSVTISMKSVIEQQLRDWLSFNALRMQFYVLLVFKPGHNLRLPNPLSKKKRILRKEFFWDL